ncbi:MAG TPA: TIGR03067 domain-containing protein [Isosphaeraceae bacterium]
MADESNSNTMVIVAIIGAIGAIGAALIPIILAERSPPPPIVIAPPAVAPAASPEPGPATKKAAATKKALAAATDEDRIQGRWRIVTQEARAKGAISEDRDDNPVWRFHGDQLAIVRMVDGKPTPQVEGTFKLHRGPRGRGFFDASLAGTQGRKMDWVGIYDFEGDVLKVCYAVRRQPDGPAAERPTAFAVDPDSLSFNARLKRFGPPRP